MDGLATCEPPAESAPSTMSMNSTTPSVPLLPAPSPESLQDPSVPNVPVGAAAPARLDNLGPMVVNSDGVGFFESLSRPEVLRYEIRRRCRESQIGRT